MSTLLRGPATIINPAAYDLTPDGPEFEQLANTSDVDYASVDRALDGTYQDITNEDAGIGRDFDVLVALLSDANALDTANGLLDESQLFSDFLGQSDTLDSLIGSL